MRLCRRWPGLAATALLLGLGACASDQPQHARNERRVHQDGEHEHGGWREGRAGGGTNLFISPAGQPFRAPASDPYPVAAWFAAADADHDGKLTLQEFLKDSGQFFDQLDTNHDGSIDGPEISVYEHSVAPEILTVSQRGEQGGAGSGQWSGGGGGGGRMGGGMGRHSRRRSSGDDSQNAAAPQLLYQGAAPYSLIALAEPVTAADADFNGRVTREEFLAAAQRRFDELDASNTGYLTLQGLPKTPIQAYRASHKSDRDGDRSGS